jgi:hypothetical protein
MTGRAMVLLCVLAGAGCGYTTRPDRGQARLAGGSLPRLAVLPFDVENTYRRGLEIRLTRLVNDELRARGARTTVSARDAEWLLRGAITSAVERVYSEDRDDRVRESSILISGEVVLVDARTEKELGAYPFTERAPYSSRAGRIATVEQAQEEALRDIAERVVNWLETCKPKDDNHE